MKRTIVLLSIMAAAFTTQAQTIIPLYPGKIPNSITVPDPEVRTVDKSGNVRYSKTSVPTLEIMLPEKDIANGTAVIICPGGGYTLTSYTHEGIKIAAAFNKMGVAAFILKYRIPSDAYMVDKNIGPLQDAQTAIKIVRTRAKEWGVDTGKVGIIGFSAGGHLASTAGTHFNMPVIENKEKTNLRPSFMILGYPVLDLSDSLMHKGSRVNLLGENPTPEKIRLYSANYQVTSQTPPTFIVHAGDDKTVKVQNSIVMYLALLKNGVPAEMHIYPKGGHGFGINDTNTGHWIDRCQDWMRANGWVK
ncbi:alpha/beta hydrolase [Mucilaginibacter sp. HMF5004]|uniref:alpha/beta hydrolase n=1 Tax=Mucilaginibacter rivuli TaxID=2857527 RepID=UPI001C5E1528|nr:alpha/beta hydrolase [Mucilaginibacter rivuli]MBW4889537.1 alpha/beta hydrolase [Mucilaginibacter rivuli]